MTDARTSQTISGAAQGAAYGSAFGPVGTGIGAAVGAIGGLISGSSADAQFENQQAWAQYNLALRDKIAQANISNGLAISSLNASLDLAGAAIQSQQYLRAAEYNSRIIQATTMYNSLLLNEELDRIWEDEGLDLQQIENYRIRERGEIVANQAASGTVIGEGSNQEVIVDQGVQRAMDATIVSRDADRKAANIMNQMVQGLWQGQVAIDQTMWEGRNKALITTFNAGTRALGTLTTANIKATSDTYSRVLAYNQGQYDIYNTAQQYSYQQNQNMISGLFNAAGTYATIYAAQKVPGASETQSTQGTGAYLSPQWDGSTTYRAPWQGSNTPGTSLISGG